MPVLMGTVEKKPHPQTLIIKSIDYTTSTIVDQSNLSYWDWTKVTIHTHTCIALSYVNAQS